MWLLESPALLAAPFTIAVAGMAFGGLMMSINRAMLMRAFGFVAGGAAAAFGGGVAVDLLQKGVPAIRHAALNHAQRTAFADGGAGFPVGVRFDGADVPEPRGGKFTDRFQDEASHAGSRC